MPDVHNVFDRSAGEWDSDPRRVRTARKVAAAIREQVTLNKEMKALDFGCGTGLVSLEILPFIKALTAVDISAERLNDFRYKLSTMNITNVQIINSDWQQMDFGPNVYDLIFSSMTLHHIPEYLKLLSKLFSILKGNGCLCLADLFPEKGDFHSRSGNVAHFGFDPERLKLDLLRMGFKNVSFEKIQTIRKHLQNGIRKDFPVFLMVAGK